MNKQYFVRNDAEIAARVLDGEAILINLNNGVYYVINPVGSWMWNALGSGTELTAAVGALAEQLNIDVSVAEADVGRFVASLCEEGILMRVESPPAADSQLFETRPGTVYEEPTLKTYRDMQDMLALDPPMPRLRNTPWDDHSQ